MTCADEEIELELGPGFCVDGSPRLPKRFARALALVGLGHGPVRLRRLPVVGRVGGATNKQSSSTASALVSSASFVYNIKIAVGYVVMRAPTSGRKNSRGTSRGEHVCVKLHRSKHPRTVV